MKQKIITLFAILTILIACKSSIPEGIIPPNKMIPILEEVHLVDAMLSNKRIASGSEEALNYYEFIYTKHNITRNDFNRSMTYYSQNPKELRVTYVEILKRLATRDSIVKAEEKAQVDTLQLWTGKDAYKVEKFTTETLPVCLPVSYQKNYTISAEIKLYKDSQIKEISPSFVFEAPDTLYKLPTQTITADTEFQKFEITALVSDSTVLDLSGDFIPAASDSLEQFKHYEIRNISITTTVLHSENKRDSLKLLIAE